MAHFTSTSIVRPTVCDARRGLGLTLLGCVFAGSSLLGIASAQVSPGLRRAVPSFERVPLCGPNGTAVNLAVPPIGSGGSGLPAQDKTISSMTLSGIGGKVTSLDVHVDLLHQQTGDLVLTLITPDATRITLANHRGSNGVNFLNTVFRDGAATPICSGTAPFTGEYRPEQPIGSWSGNGTWTLEVEDTVPGGAGVLLEWWVDAVSSSVGGNVGAISAETRWIWNHRTAPAISHQGIAQGLTHVFHSAGTVVEATQKVDGAVSWTRDLTPTAPLRPLTLQAFGGTDLVVVPGSDGFVYALNATNGATVWSRSTRRTTCSADTIIATAAAQLGRRSDCTFQAAFPSEDLLFVGTAFACGTTTANRVVALNVSSGTIRWQFNLTSSYQVDRVTGLVVDHERNRVYAATEKTNPATQNTIMSLNTLTGARVWGRDLGAILVEPILSTRGLYVLTAAGELHLINPDTGTDIWTLALAGGPYQGSFALDPLHHYLFMNDSGGHVVAVADAGASAVTVWSSVGVHLYASVVVAPFLAKVYAGEIGTSRLAQFDKDTGMYEGYFEFSTGATDPPLQMLVDSMVGGTYEEARLNAYLNGRVSRIMIPSHGTAVNGGPLGTSEPTVGPSFLFFPDGGSLPYVHSVGQNFVDTIYVHSVGNRVAHAVDIRTPVPSGMSFVGGSSSQGAVFVSGSEVVARLWNVQIGQTVAFTVTWRLNLAGPHTRYYTASFPCPTYRLFQPFIYNVP